MAQYLSTGGEPVPEEQCILAARQPPGAKPPAPPLSAHPGDRDIEGNAVAAVEAFLDFFEQKLLDILDGRQTLDGRRQTRFGFVNDAAPLDSLISGLDLVDAFGLEGKVSKQGLRLWEGSKLYGPGRVPTTNTARERRSTVSNCAVTFLAPWSTPWALTWKRTAGVLSGRGSLISNK